MTYAVPHQSPSRVLWFASVCLLMTAGCRTISPSGTDTSLPGTPQTFSHVEFDRVLQHFVDGDGRVDYIALKDSSQALDRYFGLIARYSPDSHPELFSTDESRLTYWLNAYNAAAMKAVVRRYPITSVQDVGPPKLLFFLPDLSGFFVFQRMKFGGESMSLRHLENELIRERFSDPRVHFALNCASSSCPRLPNRAFSAEHLDDELEREARKFVAEERNVRIDDEQRVVFLSQIFEWYEGDFVSWYEENFPGRRADLIAYIALYLPEGPAGRLLGDVAHYEVRFTTYDWSLNDQNGGPGGRP